MTDVKKLNLKNSNDKLTIYHELVVDLLSIINWSQIIDGLELDES